MRSNKMETTKKYKWALAGFILMLVLNILTLTALWMTRPASQPWRGDGEDGRNRQAMHQQMKEVIGLSEDQTKAMGRMRRDHFDEMRTLRRNLEETRRRYLRSSLTDTSPSSIRRDSLMDQLTRQYTLIDQAMAQHIQDMQSVLHEEQRELFQELILDSFMRRPMDNHRGMKGPGR